MSGILPRGTIGIQNYTQVYNRETLFAFAFGTEAVAPIEVGLESIRVKFANAERNEETLRLNLDLLEEE